MKPVLAVLVMLAAACGTGPKETGNNELLDRDLFKEVLLEAQLIEARANHELMVEHRTEVPTDLYYEDLFAEKGITRERFERTYAGYLERPEELKAIYDEIVVELGRRKDAPAQ